jgi:ThiF family protein
VSLPRYLSRVHDAAGPLLGGMAESELGEWLRRTSLVLEIGEEEAADESQRAGYMLAVNLAARLYPRLGLEAPETLLEEARGLARSINSVGEFGPPRSGDRTLTLSWQGGPPGPERVTVAASGWNVSIDGEGAATSPAMAPAAMAAAAIGVGELFRALFAGRLAHGREAPNPLGLNLVTLGEPADVPVPPASVDLGDVHLAGCGAIGQAAVATLRELPVTGTLFAVDHDSIDLGNLQRYVLTAEADEGAAKPDLIVRALSAHPLEVESVRARWGADERTHPGRETVLSALDDTQGRIELQAGLPRELFNAWTQPDDVGVSRHQAFGEDPCLACIAWPRRSRPSESELIAAALGEHELRVVIYLCQRMPGTGAPMPVGLPLPPDLIAPTRRLSLPDDHQRWAERSLLDDLIERYELPQAELEPFRERGVGALYRDAVCGGLLLEHGASAERRPELSVPLAHQSALAGILLATWLFVDRVPELRDLRPEPTQARYDVTRGGPQIWPRPSSRQPRCLCADPDFRAAYRARWATDRGCDP